MKNIIFWVVTSVFFMFYFQLFSHTLGNIVPQGAIGNMISILILIIVNIPLSAFSAEKLIKAIKRM